MRTVIAFHRHFELNIIKSIFRQTQLNIIFLLYLAPPLRVIEVGGDNIMNEFYDYLRNIDKSENTAKNYCDKVRIYNQWCMDSFGTVPLTLF